MNRPITVGEKPSKINWMIMEVTLRTSDLNKFLGYINRIVINNNTRFRDVRRIIYLCTMK